MTIILKCNCTSAYQDAKYGAGNRVHNAREGKYFGQFRCTVCATVKTK